MRKIILLFFVFPILLLSQENKKIEHIKGLINFDEPERIINIVPLENVVNISLPNKIGLSRNFTPKMTEPLSSKTGSDVLYPTQFSAFEINTITKTINYIPPDYSISPICYNAINISPLWLEKQLILKFRELKPLGLDDDYAQLILDAEKTDKRIVDEVAFQIANLAANSLNNSRFKADREYLIRNAQFIYKVVDSLKYVELVEQGSYESRNYYTTTKYKIGEGKNGPISWVELPFDKYYWYIVHPKLNAEGVWVQDNVNDQQQRTWGFSWQDYIWSNPDPSHDYTHVNLSANGVSVDFIPRLGAIMQGPEILWNRNKNYYNFGRPIQTYEHALDLLGNWGSCAIPADPIANQPRAIHPNQVLYYHRGRCGEDSYLMTAACRTALIPAICSGTSREDHVWDQFWDNNWNHFEFFRGGLAYSGWGWTNLMDMGGYEELAPDYWVLSFVHGYRPDGFIFNHTKYYTKTCELKLKLVDNNNLPLDGIQTKIFARPGHNNDPNDNGILYSGQAFSNSLGEVSMLAGDKKVYYLQLYHPKIGTLPAEGQVYRFTSESVFTNYDRVYDAGTVKIPVNIQKLDATSEHAPEFGQFGVHLKWKATEIITGINDLDYQKSKFYFWNDTIGSVSFFVCDENNFNKFKSKQLFNAYEVYNYTDSGDVNIAFPSDGKWYVVLSNTQAYNNYQNIDATCELLENVQTSVLVNGDPLLDVEVSNIQNDNIIFNILPNPFSDYCSFELPVNTKRVEIYNNLGVLLDTLNYPFYWKPDKNLSNGYYIFKAISDNNYYVKQGLLLR